MIELGEGTIVTTVSRCAAILAKTFYNKYNAVLQPCDMENWLASLISDHYGEIPNVLDYFYKSKHLKPPTVIKYLEDLESAVKWFVYYYMSSSSSSSPQIKSSGLHVVMADQRKLYKKKNKILRRRRPTMEDKVYDGELPAGGLAAVQAIVRTVTAEMERTLAAVRSGDIEMTSSLHNELTKTIVANMYGLSVQGRIGGIHSVAVGQGEKLLKEGITHSSFFKTSETYGFQPVTMHASCLPLLKAYVEIARPWATGVKNPPVDAKLFVRHDGSDMTARELGRGLSSFFKAFGMKITTTKIRHLIETQAQRLYEDGCISLAARSAVASCNGHTLEIAKNTYVKRQRTVDAKNANQLFEFMDAAADSSCLSMCNNGTPDVTDVFAGDATLSACWDHHRMSPATRATMPPAETRVSPAVTTDATVFREIHLRGDMPIKDWGTSHPCYGMTGRSIQWSSAELNYVGRTFSAIARTEPQNRNKYAECLRRICLDNTATAIFHPHHIFNSDRIKNGYNSYEKLKERQGSPC
jgi:hypothetical protein